MNCRLIAACLVLVLGVAACSSGSDDPPARPGPSPKHCPAGLADSIKAWGEAGFTGTMTIRRGKKSCTVTAGSRDPESGERMDRDTVFAIGSVSKAFTAAAIVQLIDEGKLSPDATAGSLVDGLSGPASRATVDQP